MLKELTQATRGLGLAAGLGLATGHAAIVKPYIDSSETLVGGAGLVNIVEVQVVEPLGVANPAEGGDIAEGFDPGVSDMWVGYFVDVQASGVAVESFAISLNNFSLAQVQNRSGWGAMTIGAEDWDVGVPLPNGQFTGALGSYQTFFEASSPAVAFFWADALGGGLAVDEDSDQDTPLHDNPFEIQFRLASESTPFSSTLVFGSGGSIIDGSTIPEPSVALLGVLALGTFFRRRR